MLKKKVFISIVSLLISINCFSQMQLGGTFGLGITNNYFSADIAPELSYTLVKHLKVGASPFILYNRNMSSTYWTMMYGGRMFAEYHFDFNVFVHAELEYSIVSDSEGYSDDVWSLPLGIGGSTAVTEHLEAYALILYDVLYDEAWAFRTNPMFRAGVRYRL